MNSKETGISTEQAADLFEALLVLEIQNQNKLIEVLDKTSNFEDLTK